MFVLAQLIHAALALYAVLSHLQSLLFREVLPDQAVFAKRQQAYSVASVPGASSYYWSANNGAVPSISSSTSVTVNFNYATSSTAAVAVSAVNGCGTTSPSRKNVSVNLLCKEEIGDTQLLVYPNPTADATTVSFNSQDQGNAIIMLSNILGEKVQQDIISAQRGKNVFKINVESLPTGMYVLSVKTADGKISSVRLTVK
jgi:hypothetical protein